MTTSRTSCLLAAALMLLPAALAAPPFDEAHDFLWCVDAYSTIAKQEAERAAGWIGRTVSANYYAVKCKLHSHDPIRPGGLEFHSTKDAVWKARHGISGGSGTPMDPFVIENWEIAGNQKIVVATGDASSQTVETPGWRAGGWGIGIDLSLSHDCFLVRKTYVHGFNVAINKNACTTVEASNLLEDNACRIASYQYCQAK